MEVKNLGVRNFLDGTGQLAFVIEDHCPQGHQCTSVVNLGHEDRVKLVEQVLKFTKMPGAVEAEPEAPRNDDAMMSVEPGYLPDMIEAVRHAILDAGQTQRSLIEHEQADAVSQVQYRIDDMVDWLMGLR